MSELERIVQTMETGQMTLNDSLVAYQRGVTLLRHCQQTLGAAEEQIKVLEQGVLRALDEFAPQTDGAENS